MAAFDIDRFPFGNFGPVSTLLEDTEAPPVNGQFDLFPRLSIVNNSTNRLRMVTALGGYVFGEQPSRVGIFVLQPARLEP